MRMNKFNGTLDWELRLLGFCELLVVVDVIV